MRIATTTRTTNAGITISSFMTVVLVSLAFLIPGCSNPLSYDPAAVVAQDDDPDLGKVSATPATIKLTVSTDGHGVTSSNGTISVKSGTSCWLSAAPLMGYEFSAWIVTAGKATFDYGSEAIARVNLSTVNTTVRATFKAVNPTVYTLTTTNDGHGTTIPRGASSVNAGQTIYLTAFPAAGYVLKSWTCTSGRVTFESAGGGQFKTVKLVGGNATIKANFAKSSGK